MIFQEVLRTALVPLAIALACALLSLRLPARWQPLGAAAGVALAFVVAHVWIAGFASFPPHDATDATLWLAPLGLLPAALPVDRRRLPALLLWAAFAVATVWLVMRPLAGYYGWNLWSGTGWCGGAALVLLLLGRRSRGDVDNAAPAAIGVTAAGAGACAVLVHSAKLSQLSFALGVALAGVCVVLAWRPTATALARGAAAVGTMALGALLLAIRLYAELAWLPLLLLALGWASLELVPVIGRRRGARSSLFLHTGLAALPVVAAVTIALVERLSQAEDPYY